MITWQKINKEIMKTQDVMIDIESSGLYAEEHAIIQIGAVPFDRATRELGEPFNECLSIPEDRKWMPHTEKWWNETNPYRLEEIISKGKYHRKILLYFKEYIESFDGEVRFWSHHTLDWEMIQNYYRSYNIKSPFCYSSFIDLDSYLEALVPNDIGKFRPVVNPNDEHDALFDCEYQINWLFNTLDKRIVNEK